MPIKTPHQKVGKGREAGLFLLLKKKIFINKIIKKMCFVV